MFLFLHCVTPLVVFLLVPVSLQAVLLRVDGYPDLVLMPAMPRYLRIALSSSNPLLSPLLHVQDLVVPEAGLGGPVAPLHQDRVGSLEKGSFSLFLLSLLSSAASARSNLS